MKNHSSTDRISPGFLLVAILAVATAFLFLHRSMAQKSESEKPTTAAAASDSQKMSDAELRQRLTPEQYHVIKEDGTEPPFKNEYWDNHKEGIYVDRISGEALFSSKDKFESGTGWPSFTKPLAKENVVEKSDGSLGTERTEVRSKASDAHLGHIFNDGPPPTGMRYCMNSASLRFVPVEKLKEAGYEKFLPLFEEKK